MATIKNVWSKIDGYKTAGAMVILLLLRGIKLIWPEFVNVEVYQWIQDVLLMFGGFGVGDKVRKTVIKK